MDINWLGVGVAFLAGMLVAFGWYQKGPIADAWERLTGVTPERSRPARVRNMAQLALANAVTAAGMGAAVALASASGSESVGVALATGLAAWLAFSATTLVQHNAFELKPARLTLINTGYQLTTYLAMALAISLT